jgi:hypothetical protein
MALLATGCLGTLTPHDIDVETLPPEQQEVVTKAMNFLETSRMEFQSPPRVVLVKKQGSSWQVVLEGDMRVVPPDPLHALTPGPFVHQCAYITIDPIDHHNSLLNGTCTRR